MKKFAFLPLLLILLLGGCATEYGKLQDGREYYEYDIKFDKDKGKFYIPLERKTEESQAK